MKRIIDKNDSGKTKQLLIETVNNNGTFVCHNPDYMKSKAFAYGLSIENIRFMSYYEYITSKKDESINRVYIDDLDTFLNFYDKNINGYTISKDD